MNREAWRAEFSGKRILIWGFGREGRSSLSFIRAICPEVTPDIADGGNLDAIRAEAKALGAGNVFSQEEAAFSSYDLILKSPGIVIPSGMDCSNLTQQSHLFLKHQGPQTIGITGTKGKSTTSSVTAAILSKGYRTHLIGNIGIPCFDILLDLSDEDLCVFEISCHQLEYCPYSPRVGVYLNLYEEHLDHYESFQAYGDAKANIFRHQGEGDLAILNAELPYVTERKDALLIGRDININATSFITPNSVIPIPETRLIGTHNQMNLAVAWTIAQFYSISQVQFEEAVREFQPLHHRLEPVGEYHGIRFVNDSISTIGQASIAALNSLPETDVILIGGMDRGIDYRELEDYLAGRKDLWVIFMYAVGARIYEELSERSLLHERMLLAEDLEEAVRIGSAHCRKGHILLLSPAASSYDHFKNFEERGEVFARLAEEL
ncbi:MAG: UDP-N-acetylmuramoyl-L-alanine--D-glutamate ligase [Solobacterium sp.]|nr:UDP-N-acetylmuramoyl-L-alanine--D-glutamate ligase [Solobacterium sp.]